MFDDFGWEKPQRNGQQSLFPRTRAEVLAMAKISESDLIHWRDAGWLKSDFWSTEMLDEPEVYELCFIRNLARSGLCADDIDRLLYELEAPYCYCPTRTAYSFAFGWVQSLTQPSLDDIDEFMEKHLLEWAKAKVAADPDSVLLHEVLYAVIHARAEQKGEAGVQED